MTALVFFVFAAHVIAWIVLPHRASEPVREAAPSFGHAAATA
jgi:hypothetical protein